MAPGRYTELFFTDEASALAAGHRPCAECRRAAYNSYRGAWQVGHGNTEMIRARDIDITLHSQRVQSRTRQKTTYEGDLSSLPDGAFFSLPAAPDVAVMKYRDRLWRWSFAGYELVSGSAGLANQRQMINILTPEASVRTLSAGYQPVLHPSISDHIQ